MNFSSSFIRPAKVIQVVDSRGTIKATCPGLFSVNDKPEDLPPIYPFIQVGSSSFSSPLKDDIVWVLHDTSNTQMFYYIRLVRFDDDTKSLLDRGEENVEVLFSRDTDSGLYQLYFSDGTGIKLLKDNNYIKISPEGNIDIVTDRSNRSISITDDSICIGADSGNAESIGTHAAYGERVEECLNNIYNILSQLQKAANTSPYTSSLNSAFAMLPDLNKNISTITSQDVKIV